MARNRKAVERVEAVLRLAPDPVKAAAKRAAGPFDVVQRARFRRRTGYAAPVPPAVLRARIGVGIDVAHFVGTGLEAAETIKTAVAGQGRDLAELSLVYDWGCGCGRLLIPLEQHVRAGTVLAGSDVDDEAIAWLQGARPAMRLAVNGFQPPLPAADGEVDLLISSSILTHLSEPDQDSWLAEVRRVLAPGGIALISVCGHGMHDAMRTGRIQTRDKDLTARLAEMPDLDDKGFIFVPYQRTGWNERDFPGVTGQYGLAFHSPAYVDERWGKWFDVAGQDERALNAHQDLVVLRRKP